MRATTVTIAITVDGNHDEATQHLGGRIANLLDRYWPEARLPHRLATDIRVHLHDDDDIADLLNKVALGEIA